MKMRFQRHGRQFFFFTFCVEGRKPVLSPYTRWIKMVPHGLPPRYNPSVEDSRAFAEGRLLVLSSFPPEIPVSPISRENCELMNARILKLCGPAAEPINTSKDGGLRPPSPPAPLVP